MKRRYVIFAITFVLSLVADQWSKVWARGELSMGHPVPVFEPVWYWELSYNTGAAFGLFRDTPGGRIFLSIIAFVAFIAIVYILARKTTDDRTFSTLGLGLLASGAVGNVIDRLLYGKVTDFVLWRAGDFRWPQFNIADAALVVGVVILLFADIGRKDADKDKDKTDAPKKGARAKAK
jgi:signal peptidase II